MKKKYILFFLLFLFSIPNLYPQKENLVLNPGFESYTTCPERHTAENGSHRLAVNHWSYPTLRAPDYFNRCSTGDEVDVPANFAGEAEPHSGDGYMGGILSGSEVEYREYIQGKLKKTLKKGQRYCVTFHYRLASFSRFAMDQMSVYFSNDKVESSSKANLAVEPQLTNTPGLFIDNTTEWEQYCRIYTATGGENFIIIGNFKSYAQTNYVAKDKHAVNKHNKTYAYYFFDDVSVVPITNCEYCPCVAHDFEVVVTDSSYTGGANPMTGKTKKLINDGSISIAISGGTPPYRIAWSNGSQSKKLENLPAGLYTYKVTDDFNCIAGGAVRFTEPETEKPEKEGKFEKIEPGTAIILKNIFFDFGKATLLPASYTELDKLVEFINKNKLKLVEISGHTDWDGSDSFNQKLSENRAKAVAEYLKSKGIEESRVIYAGYGESKPVDTNLTEKGRAKNRRVEFKILKM